MRLALVVAALQAGLGLRLPRFPPTSAGALSSRREVVGAAATLSLGLLVSPRAASASLDPSDLSRFKKALAGVDYLLDNWDKETQECTTSGNGECKDSPDKVRYYFGLRTTDHPLFGLDKETQECTTSGNGECKDSP